LHRGKSEKSEDGQTPKLRKSGKRDNKQIRFLNGTDFFLKNWGKSPQPENI